MLRSSVAFGSPKVNAGQRTFAHKENKVGLSEVRVEGQPSGGSRCAVGVAFRDEGWHPSLAGGEACV